MKTFFVAAAAFASFIASAVAGPLESRGFTGGYVTFNRGGNTACGTNVITETQDSVAISPNVFNSYGNDICQAHIRAFLPSTGITIVVPVVDSCAGCRDQDLDLSEKSFLALGLQLSEGRGSGVEWEFV